MRTPSVVAYRGPSMLDGSPIVAIVTFDSKNDKTGDMSQLWILPADIAPHDAVRLGLDASVCGDCKHRPVLAKETGEPACYVKVFQAPLATWKANRNVPADLARACTAVAVYNRPIRLGAYGDPAALPRHVVESLVQAARKASHAGLSPDHTGYTHQWRDPRFAWLRSYVMASADSEAERDEAHANGWRTFRVYPKRSLPMLSKAEILCPSERIECADCRLCNGARPEDRRKSIAIMDHA